jgi:hypothetical protein
LDEVTRKTVTGKLVWGLGMNSQVGVGEKISFLCLLALLVVAPLCVTTPLDAAPVQGPQAASSQDPNANQQAAAPMAVPEAGKPAQVTYQDGKLMILAENSTLSEVLLAVRAATGTNIDLPGGAAPQRIWIRLGPGPARQILRDLLDSTEFNYVIQASATDPDGVASISLSLRSKGSDSGVAGTQVARVLNRRGASGNPNAAESEQQDEPAAQTAAPATSAAATSPAPPPSSDVPLPDSLPLASQLGRIQPLSPNAEPGSVKPLGGSPSEMIQQLQSMYEQRRQLQIQQNQKVPTTN